eukprot:CAMPEP_0116093764 /NCGR_PEP_ID=MMETSP0327-20121206/8771_1 /TAXON_ID=44447 /ORGANISM="Pseudo-nitzschia delicatissima, Strain B596" /LENGTH=519 /DNA_ID=CAMNT_0003585321 /DNA_START=13 /DNA_END=1575 /DNA_ORIENTATION=+
MNEAPILLNHNRQRERHANKNLRATALPWATMVIVSVVAAAYVSYQNNRDDFDFDRLLESETHQYVHKPVYNEEHASLFPLTTSDRIGFSLAICGLMIAAGGGIGGGGILVPIYILVMGFSPKHGIPLSNVTVFGGAIANMVVNTRKRHPLADRPLIDWDLILVMEPLTIAGALMGAFLNKILPEQFLTFMLVLLLSFTAYNSLKKAVKMYRKESRKLREQGLKPDGSKESELTHINQQEAEETMNEAGDELLEDMDLQDGESPGGGAALDGLPVDANEALLKKILEEERVTPIFNVKVLVGLFVVVLAMNLLKGGGAFPSPIGITCGSNAFWIANVIILGWIVVISIYARNYLVKRNNLKHRIGYQTMEGDIQWDERSTVVYPCICCLAGFFAGMFGIGGGIVKGPLMLAMDVHPGVASASSACMIFFTSFTATTSFFVFGLLDPQYAPVCFCIGFVATYFGQIGLSILMRRAKRNSYIAFSIGGVVLLSAILMTAQSLLSMAEGEHHSSGGICGKES